MSITYKVAEYIIKQGKVNALDIADHIDDHIDTSYSWERAVDAIKTLEKVGVISPVEKGVSKLMTTVPRQILIKDLERVKQLLIEVKEPEILKGNEHK